MNIAQLEMGVTNYINAELIPKAPSHIKFLMYTGMAMVMPKFEEMYNQYKDNGIVNTLGIIKPDGDIDVDMLYRGMKDAMQKMHKVEFMGIVFMEEDVDKLYQHLI